jgi:8-oxo-dGTP diphosphatase
MTSEKSVLRPKVGIGVAVVREGKFLLGKRRGAHGEGSWAFPGGHLEYGETPEACAMRELEEETGLKARSLKVSSWTNDIFENGQQYITIFFLVEQFEGEPQRLEPDKCEGWSWFTRSDFPSPLFPSVRSFMEKERQAEGKTIDLLLADLTAFHQEREWDQFHSPKNLAMNLACEVGELLEPFRWLTEKQSAELDGRTLEEVKDEIGDVFIMLVCLAHKLGIDPIEASQSKLVKIGQKYPADLSRGKNLKYTAYTT